MRLARATKQSIPIALVALFTIGCADEGHKAEPLVIRSNVHVIKVPALAPLEPNQLKFPAAGNDDLLARQPGDVLVSPKGPTGFLRKVMAAPSVQGETIIIPTQDGSLADIFASGDLYFEVTPMAPQAGGQSLHAQPRDPGDITFDVFGPLSFGAGVHITPYGSLSLNPKFNAHAHFSIFSGIDELEITMEGDERLTLGAQVKVDGSVV